MTTSISAVRTTGIYCRDGCSARPLARNVSRYPSSVAAEAAGFRPCLRCRPDRLPPTIEGDSQALVGRALLLIADGLLDETSEEGLASRLGVTARHLRRLFHEQVGATPVFVARSRRAHFARRMLDETDLAMADVAFTSGFNSVRQMNREMLAVFRFPPSELRARRRSADRLVADGGIRLRVPYAGALAFDAMLTYLKARAIPGVEAIEGGTYRRTMTSCGLAGAIEVSQAADGQHLLVVAHLPSLGSMIDDVARCRRLFGLDRPAAEQTPLARDPLLAGSIQALPGLRVPGTWDPFETVIRILLGQQVSVAGATTLAGRLVEAFGEPVSGLSGFGLSRVFPPAVTIAEARVEQIRAVGLPDARARAIRAFAQAYAEERVHLDASRPLDETVATLEALPGIGPWTAQMIALRCCGQLDAFPSGDLGLRRAVGRLLGAPEVVAEAEVVRVAEAWRPYRALAAMHLWMSR